MLRLKSRHLLRLIKPTKATQGVVYFLEQPFVLSQLSWLRGATWRRRWVRPFICAAFSSVIEIVYVVGKIWSQHQDLINVALQWMEYNGYNTKKDTTLNWSPASNPSLSGSIHNFVAVKNQIKSNQSIMQYPKL